MRKLLKIISWGVVGLVAVVAVVATVIYWRSNGLLGKQFVVTVKPVAIPENEAAIARGRHLVETRGCVDCHGADLAGGKVIEDGPMGVIHGPNLTRGRGGRVAAFSDEDWVRSIRHGVGPDGRGLYLMPSEEYSHFSDEDLGALIAYLKTIPSVDRERVPLKLGPVARVLLATGKIKLASEVIDHANLQTASVTPAVTVEYGRYVAASCTGCHGPTYAGGKIEVGPPGWPRAANLTPHPESRMASWTEAEFVSVMRTAKRPDGSELDPVMPRVFGGMDDVELKALWAFFRSLPPLPMGAR